MKKIYFLLVIFTFIFSCKKSEDPAPVNVTLLTYQQNTSTATTDDWIYVTDEEGTILDVKQYESGQTIILQTTKKLPSQKINVSILSKNSTTDGGGINTYLGININDSWVVNNATFKDLIFIPNTPPKQVKLQVKNLILSSNRDYGVSTIYGVGSSSSTSGSTVTFDFNATDSPSICASAYRNNQPVYFETKNTAGTTSFLADLNTDFKPLDHTFNFSYTTGIPLYVEIAGFHKNENNNTFGYLPDLYYLGGYVQNLQDRIATSPSSTISLGYNDGFDLYNTYADYSTDKIKRIYRKFVTPPTSISIPDHTLALTNSTYSNFAFTLSGDFTYRQSTWTSNVPGTSTPQLNWNVTSAKDGKQILGNVPTEIKTKYPSLDFSSFTYRNTIFYRTFDGFTYDDFVNTIIKQSTAKKFYSKEFQSVQFINQ